MAQVCKKFWVSGHVQGVWYRANTQAQADKLGITGYAKNLADGRVEVVACGDDAAIDTLEKWLWQGPERAEVTDVTSAAMDWMHYSDFSTH
tara:strand:+ start:9364 stop:9636 length:273 start_codon:yes stop_codon:yes gene_type:complete